MFGKKSEIKRWRKTFEPYLQTFLFDYAKLKSDFFDKNIKYFFDTKVNDTFDSAMLFIKSGDDLKESMMSVADVFEEMSSFPTMWDSDEERLDFENSLTIEDQQKFIHQSIMLLLPLMPNYCNTYRMLLGVRILVTEYTDWFLTLASYQNESSDEQSKKTSMDLCRSLYESKLGLLWDGMCKQVPSAAGNEHLRDMFMEIANESDNIDKWLELYNDKFLGKIHQICMSLQSIVDYANKTDKVKKYFGADADFPSKYSALNTKGILIPEFYEKLLAEYEAGKIYGSPTKEDVERIYNSVKK